MENITDQQMEIARILLNLGHAYLHSISLENSEDKAKECEEQKEEEEEDDDDDDDEEEEYDKKKIELGVEQQLNEQNKYTDEIKEEKLKFPKSIEEEMKVEFNKVKQDKSFNYRITEIDKEIQKVHTFGEKMLHELDSNTLQTFNINNKQELVKNEEIELDNTMIVDLKYIQELDKTVHKELEKQQIPKENTEEMLFIEMEVNSDLPRLDRKMKTNIEGNTEFNIDLEIQVKKKETQVLDKKKQKIIDIENQQKLKASEIINYNINMQHNFENIVKIKSNKNVNLYEQIIDEIQNISINNIQDDFKNKQNLNAKIDEIDIGGKKTSPMRFIGEKMEEINKEKQGVEYILFDKNIQFDSKTQQVLCNNIQKKFKEKPQLFVKGIQFMFDGKLLTECDKMKQLYINRETEFDNENIKFDKTKIQQKIEEDRQDKIKIKSSREVNVASPLEFNKNEQNKSYINVDQMFDKETEVKFDSDILFPSELKTHTIIHKKLIETFNTKLQQGINSIIHGIVMKKQNIDDRILLLNSSSANQELIELIQQEIKELQREIEKLYEEKDEELEKAIIVKVNKIYLSHYSFLGNLIHLLNKDSTSLIKRVEELYNLYLPFTKKSLRELQKEFYENIVKFEDEILEELDEEMQTNCVNIDKNKIKIHKEIGTEIQKQFDSKTQKMYGIKSEEYDVDIEKVSDVDIEEYSNLDIEKLFGININEFYDINFEEFSAVDIEKLLNVDIEKHSDVDIEDHSEVKLEVTYEKKNNFPIEIKKEHNYSEEEFKDQNEYIVEINKVSSEDNFIESCSIKEYYYTKEEFTPKEKELSLTKEIENLKIEIKKKPNKEDQEQFNKNVLMFKEDTQEIIDQKLQQKLEKSHGKVEDENSQKINGSLQLKTEDFDDIPLELKVQEQLEEKQYKQFQKECYTNSKLEYDDKQLLKVNNSNNLKILHLFDEQQQTFYELEDELHEIKQEYKNLIQNKIFEELQRDIDQNILLEIEDFPEESLAELNLEFDEDINNEFVKQQRDCFELQSEFKNNLPLEIDENDLNQLLKIKSINIFNKLQYIHKQKLCNFVDSKQWPEICLYPSSLLDSLFENPTEITPNVLIITLYSVDVGYSIKLSMDKNDSPVEIFFNYSEDSILKYVERGQLPPNLLDLLHETEPNLFYCGSIIAEIHNKKYGILCELYRILLSPFNMSIQSDLKQLLAENSNIDWTYKKKLKLESLLLLISHPNMCMDLSPIAGLTVHLQHQMLSSRSINLNPLKKIYIAPSMLKPLEINLTDDLHDDNKSANTPELFSELKRTFSKSMDLRDDYIHYVTWKFDFRVESFKLIKLYVLMVKETLEHSMLLCIDPKLEFFINIRFKIDIEKNKLKPYINVIQDILRQKLNHDISVVRRYKSDDNLPLQSVTYIPTLFSDQIYEPCHVEINQLINKLLENKIEYLCDIIELELKTNNSLVMSSNVSDDAQRPDEIEKRVEHTCNVKKNNRIFMTNLFSKNTHYKENQIISDGVPLLSSSLCAPVISPLLNSVSKIPSLISHPFNILFKTNIDYNLEEIPLCSPTDQNKLQELKDYKLEKDTNLKSEVTLSKFKHLKYLNKNIDFAINESNYIKDQSPVICNATKESQSFHTQDSEKVTVIKHVHNAGICLNYSTNIVNKPISQITTSLLQKTSSVNQTSTTDIQLGH